MRFDLPARLRSWLRAAVGRRTFEDGLADEVRFHLDAYTDDLIQQGVPPAEARRRARLEFGGVETVREDCRQARGLRAIDQCRRDTRDAGRRLRRSPGFAVAAIGTIALVVGANLAIFAVVDAVLLRPLPFPAADRLVSVYNTYPAAGVTNDGASLTNYYERRGAIDAFASVSAYRDAFALVGEGGATERVPATWVSPDFFTTLGVGPALGRAFTETETTYATNAVAVITDAFWRNWLDRDPDALGRTVRVNGRATEVVGILPPEFRFLSSTSRLYFPLASTPDERAQAQRHSGNSDMIARLAPERSLTEAQVQIDAHNDRLEAGNPMAPAMADAGFRSLVAPLHADHVAAVRPMLWLLQGGALCLLLIGVVNVSNLLLVRAGGRSRELAVRQAIGASRAQLAAAVVVDTTVMTLVGGALGMVVGAAGLGLLAAIGADRLPLGARIAFDGRLALDALAFSVLAGVAIGLPVAWWQLRAGASPRLRIESRGNTGHRAAGRLRHAFVIAQVALAFVLLAGAGQLATSLWRVEAEPAGFRSEHVLTGRVSVTRSQFETAADLIGFVERVRVELERQPGVEAVGLSTNIPLSGISNKSAVTVRDHVRAAGESPQGHYAYSVDGDLFDALGMTVVSGRALTADDSRRPDRVAVVDDAFARRYWPDDTAIGQHIWSGSGDQPDDQAFRIVGVVDAMKQAALSEDGQQGAAYFPFGHRLDGSFYLVTRTSGSPTDVGAVVERVVRRLQPDLPVSDLRTMDALVGDSLVPRRSPALLAVWFAGIALLLTTLGTYGVLAYAVAQRRREIGVRLALGARAGQVGLHVAATGLRALAVGTALGLAGAWVSGHALQALLFDVPALYPPALAGAATALIATSAAASLLPALRAARTSPLVVLSEE